MSWAWVKSDLKPPNTGFSYPVVLIGSYSHKTCLKEGERAEVPVCI